MSDFPTLEDYVGQTPLVRLQRLNAGRSTVLVKLEGNNPAGSVKDRPALNMIVQAEARGSLQPGDTIIEATSGNTGIALAMAAAIKGYKMILIMPDNATQERKDSMRAYGAELILVSKEQGMEGARDLALQMQQEGKGKVLDQFNNLDNPDAHFRSTGPEIWQQSQGKITHFVSSMGTTGTIMGVSRYLKQQNPQIQIIGLQPSEGSAIPGIRRWPQAYLPGIFDAARVDQVLDVTQTDAEQTALIALMAHIGSYVPAESASIGPLDRIFTRIGASDDLASGRSTFMVEMTETANILHNATCNSLVLMDEIGRGTSTYDGLSLAWASAEWLAKEIGAMTLFATHYFELTELPNVLPHLANVHLDAVEHGDGIAFMHAVQEGAASKSYGLAVAGLAGVPKPVIKNARAKLQQLELLSSQPAETRKPSRVDIANQLSLIPEPSAVEQALAGVDPDQLTPRQALDMLYQLKKLL